jgi:hypothetical protein
MIFATTLNLLFIPVLYVIAETLREKRHGTSIAASAAPPSPAPPA